jgi:hypothetical protein
MLGKIQMLEIRAGKWSSPFVNCASEREAPKEVDGTSKVKTRLRCRTFGS